MIRFDNTYTKLPERFFERVLAAQFPKTELTCFNDELSKELGFDQTKYSNDELAKIFSGQNLLPGADPIAQAYAGHQFGRFVPQLGDGRAILLGEVLDTNQKRKDIQLKGSGRTKFSRGGDGKAALGPMIREFIIGEAMHALGIPTTRALAIVKTGEDIQRDQLLPGAVLTRVASSHIRVGTFEYFASRNDAEAVQLLADYLIERHYPESTQNPNPYIALFEAATRRQASLISQWMHVGFIHGVMNTDNMALSGESIDFGPCAFMDFYDPLTVYSSIDRDGRYAYSNQPQIALWNLKSFGNCLAPLISKIPEEAEKIIDSILIEFGKTFNQDWLKGVGKKLGIVDIKEEDRPLVESWFELLAKFKADHTLSFRHLSSCLRDNSDFEVISENNSVDKQAFHSWIALWKQRVLKENQSALSIAVKMDQTNPLFIPRNHLVEAAINAAFRSNDFSKFRELNKVLKKPFTHIDHSEEFQRPPKPEELVHATFCGT